MNTRNLLVSVLMLMCVLLSACAPAATAAPIVPTAVLATSVPATEAPNEFALAGDPIPDNLLDVEYLFEKVALRLRSADDPICQELKTESNCFTFLRTDHDPKDDPGARGPAALMDGLIAAKFQLCPFCDPSEIGTIEYFELKEDGGVLVGVKCETKSGTECSADVGTTWKPAIQQTTFHSPENASFHLPLTITYGPGWETNVHANAIDIVNANPTVPQREWWGGGVTLVNGAHVADPAKITGPAQMKTSSLSDFLPWPDDFFAYVASIPGIKIMQAPTPVTIGGIQGTQIVIRTPEVMHTMLWLKDDWTGLGNDYSNRIEMVILLDVNGEPVLLEFDDSPDKFDEHYPLIQEIFNSITFTK